MKVTDKMHSTCAHWPVYAYQEASHKTAV